MSQATFKHIEAHKPSEGGYRYIWRKLAVFPNYLLLDSSDHSDQDWADMFNLPLAAIVEARLICTKVKKDAFDQWRSAKLAEDAADDELLAAE